MTPDEIAERTFLVALRGYDREEVAAFLQEVADNHQHLVAKIERLERASRARDASAPEDGSTASIDDAGDLRQAYRDVGDRTSRILVAAEETADEIRSEAEAHAKQTIDQAEQKRRDEIAAARKSVKELIAEGERRRASLDDDLRNAADARDALIEQLMSTAVALNDTLGKLREAAAEPLDGDDSSDTGAEEADGDDEGEDEDDERDDDEPAGAVELAEADPEPDSEASREPAATADESERGRALGSIRPTTLRSLRRTLKSLQNGTLDGVRGGLEIDQVLPNNATIEQLESSVANFLKDAFILGQRAGANAVDGSSEGLASGSEASDLAGEFRGSMAREVRSSLAATLTAGRDAEEADATLLERVGEVFRDLKGPIAEHRVDEYLTRAFEYGQQSAWRSLDVARKRWVVAHEARCPENRCAANADEGPVDLDGVFPSGDPVPPAHEACTCTLAPIA